MDTVNADDFVCPSCGGRLEGTPAGMTCSPCRHDYACVEGVPMLVPGLVVGLGPEPEAGFVDDISQAAAPTAPALAQDAMRGLFSRTFSFPDPRLGVEGHRFLHRLRSSGFAIREPHGPAAGAGTAPPAAATHDAIVLTLSTAPTSVKAGQDFWVQVRIANDGPSALPATGPHALTLSCGVEQPARWFKRWRGKARGKTATQLLIDIQPGQALTQPVHMTASPQVGPATYRVTPVRGQADWLDGLSLPVTVTGVDPSGPDPLDVDWPYSAAIRDYGEDHAHAVSLVGEWLRGRFGAREAPRVLELGGNAAPMLQVEGFGLPGARCFNLDIDPFGLVFGTVQRRFGGGRPIQDLVADGMRLPFADGSLDVIVMFATLHHFPDPVGLLRHLASKLAPGGLICACCEPVGHVGRDTVSPAFREELLGGICEQAFEPWEWRSLFERAGLRTVEAQHDRGSLKIALEPASGGLADGGGAAPGQGARPQAPEGCPQPARRGRDAS